MERHYNLKDSAILNDPINERDYRVLCKNYLKKDFIFDLLANVPIFLHDLLSGYPNGEAEMETIYQESYLVKIFMILKFLRFKHVNDVRESLKQIKEHLADTFIS